MKLFTALAGVASVAAISQEVTSDGEQECFPDETGDSTDETGDSAGHRRLPASYGAVIDNGVIKLGVTEQGALNVRNYGGASSDGITDVGLRYILPNGSEIEATAHGCTCEGWGVGMDDTVLYFNTDKGSTSQSLYTTVFNSDASTATSTVTMPNMMRVTHAYRPSEDTDNAYEVKVTLENLSGATFTDVPYRRVFDFDLPPTKFNECVTINGDPTVVDLLTSATNYGFASSNPSLPPRGASSVDAPFVNYGPADQGACFDFQFGPLAAGATREFSTYYGAASSEEEALSVLASVGAEIYALGKPNSGGSCSATDVNVFVFGLTEVGGERLLTESPTISPAPTDAPTTHSPTNTPSEPPTCAPDYVEVGNCTETLTSAECNATAIRLGYEYDVKPIKTHRMDKPFDHLPGGCFAKRMNGINERITKFRYNPHTTAGTNCGHNTTKDGRSFTKLCVCGCYDPLAYDYAYYHPGYDSA